MRIETDSGGVIHHDSQADPPGSKVRAVIELAGIERPGDPRHLTRQFDRLAGIQIVTITRHDDQGSTGCALPQAAVGDPGDLHDQPSHDPLGIAGAISFTGSGAQKLDG